MRITRAIIVLVILIALGGAWLDQWGGPSLTRVEVIAPANTTLSSASPARAPDFTVTTLSGRTLKLSDLRGHVVILHFWASWCTPCIAEFPALVALANRMQDRGVVLLALSSDTDDANIHRFIAKQSADIQRMIAQSPSIIIARDDGQRITRDTFLTTRYPETIIIDTQGNMAKKIAGVFPWEEKGGDMLRPLLPESP